jgi:membrane protein implicated in regulation of membrane protease activity
MGVFALLEGISPWWWVALAILLGAVEMVTVTTVLIWSSLAALLTGLALWFAPGLGGAEQIACFAVLSIVFTLAGRALVARYGLPGDDAAGTLNRRADQIVGRVAVVDSFEATEGKVTVDGVPWPARLAEGARTPAPGERVQVVAADGIVVRVRPI